MKVLVCGGRDFDNQMLVDMLLTPLPITVLIHGAARGADSCAADWGKRNPEVEVRAFPADWKSHGRSAGPIRNREMIKENPDLVIAFKGGKGTADMMRVAEKAGIPVHDTVKVWEETNNVHI